MLSLPGLVVARKCEEWEQRKNAAGRVVRWAWIEGAQGKVHPSPPAGDGAPRLPELGDRQHQPHHAPTSFDIGFSLNPCPRKLGARNASARGPDASHGQGFKAPEHNAPAFQARCVLLFEGERREYRDGIELLPVAEALADPTLVLA